MVTEESENADLRDRGYFYWRLLHKDPEAAKQIVLAERPVISD
jgi:AP-1 complex subunit beta-1